MSWFHNLTLKSKLLTAFSVVLACTTLLGGFSYLRLQRVNARTQEITTNWLPAVELISAVWANSGEMRYLWYRHIAADTPEEKEVADAKIAEKKAELEKNWAAYKPTITSPAEQALADNFDRAWTNYYAKWEEIRELSRARRDSAAHMAMLGESGSLRDELNKPLKALVTLNHDGGVASAAATNAEIHEAQLVIMGTLAFAIALGVTVALLIANQLSGMLRQVVAKTREVQTQALGGLRSGLDALARGDLQDAPVVSIPALGFTSRDEFGELGRTIDGMVADTQQTLESYAATQRTVTALVSASTTISNAAQVGELAERIDANAFEGSFRALATGLNDTLQAVAAPLSEMRTVMARVADRDLTARTTGTYQGEYHAITTAINSALHTIEESLLQVNAASDQVAAAGGQITSGAQLLASGASEQAASLEEISASVHTFASMAQQSATNAGEARSVAAAARQEAQEGTARMARLSDAVDQIRQSSSATAKIVKTIDEIAFQTNLLALNAAVEAARAGDAGRGFAVVAEEVRALALRAAEAAKNTSALIEEGEKSATRGVTYNAEVLQSLTRISAQIEKVAEVSAEISAATEQQVEGVTQIKGAVDQINMVTQQVAANAEESASAATELESQAVFLRDTVNQFTLTGAATSLRTSSSVSIGSGRPPARRAAVHATSPVSRAAAPVLAHAGASASSLIPFDDEGDAFEGF